MNYLLSCFFIFLCLNMAEKRRNTRMNLDDVPTTSSGCIKSESICQDIDVSGENGQEGNYLLI